MIRTLCPLEPVHSLPTNVISIRCHQFLHSPNLFVLPSVLLRQNIPTVANDVASSLVRRCIAREVEIQPLDLAYTALPPQWRHAVRFIDDLWRSAHLGVEETRRHDVDASKLSPLSRQTLAEVRDGCLGRVVDLGTNKVRERESCICLGIIRTGWSTGTFTMCAEMLEVMIRLPNPCFL